MLIGVSSSDGLAKGVAFVLMVLKKGSTFARMVL